MSIKNERTAAGRLAELGAESGAKRGGFMAAGGMLGALAASTCCILPMVLVSLGAGGAWVGNLPALAPIQPVILAITFGFLAYGYYLVYWRPRRIYGKGAARAPTFSNRIVKAVLGAAAILFAAAIVFPYAVAALGVG